MTYSYHDQFYYIPASVKALDESIEAIENAGKVLCLFISFKGVDLSIVVIVPKSVT